MSFEEFCTQEMLGGKDKETFRQWLGDKANVRMSHAEWWKWFSKWVRSKK